MKHIDPFLQCIFETLGEFLHEFSTYKTIPLRSDTSKAVYRYSLMFTKSTLVPEQIPPSTHYCQARYFSILFA